MTLEREYERNFKKKLRTFLLENKLKFFVHGSKKKKIYFTFDILEYDYQPTISVFINYSSQGMAHVCTCARIDALCLCGRMRMRVCMCIRVSLLAHHI